MDLTNIIATEDGQLNPKMSDGSVHCAKTVFPLIEKQLLTNLVFKERVRIRLTQLVEKIGIIKIARSIRKALIKSN